MIPLVATLLPRLVDPLYPDLLWRVPTASRTLYLTFDDGPTASITPRILDTLARYDAKASFFTVGSHARRHPDLMKAMLDAGHTIGNHTFTHVDAWRTPRSTVLSELERTTALLENLIERPVRWMRPPYGRFTRAIRDWCLVRHQRLTMWDIMPGDYLRNATQYGIEQMVLTHVRPGSIVVLHDNPKAESVMPAALARILWILKTDGWRFLPL